MLGMIVLEKAIVNKYKSIQQAQEISFENDVTTFVGMNEAGKTAILEALAKFNYFEDNEKFQFNPTLDYPRKELKKYQRSEEKVKVVECQYKITEFLHNKITKDLGKGVFSEQSFSEYLYYGSTNKTVCGINADSKRYLENLIKKYEIEEHESEVLLSHNFNLSKIRELLDENSSDSLVELMNELDEKILKGAWEKWKDPLANYIFRKWINPYIPKFWYYDEYFSLPSRIDLNALHQGEINDDSSQTAKALLDVAQIDLEELLSSDDFETFTAELEATSNEITDQMFEYWTANKNLEIEFKIDHQGNKKILDIRVKNQKHRVSIPLNQRSKGFNWFFSFIVWFSKIKNDKNYNYVLLLDEPGLNLHASAQADLLRFIEDLSDEYQIIYTTHSPFMVDSTKLDKVRTVYEGEEGTTISQSIQEKDSRTLFPLQAALGYEIAQNLFISEKNLLVEGPADIIYLTKLSEFLKSVDKEGLRDDVVLVPVGGLDKIPAFISLMTGNKLNIVALLDSFTNSKGKQRLDSLIMKKIIREKNIRFFDEFTDGLDKADIEDLFTKGEYLKFYNAAFPEQKILVKDLMDRNDKILTQIGQISGKNRFNHYLPAKEFLKINLTKKSLTENTINRFEDLFKTINNLF
ncbi:hypothetical protein JCM21714_3995 [Gracilibacillus boraciitolerans JCM 21714]|uniref:Uncharacterized protein n=1 Tax=Gracilibacillus boraciitolerans JCM 21714 TaxID=1298598 RepID=W4VN06_9BACI|nr:AAA family ATPase [Gracilibacillus boraciitolerans]GAE94805.1 hypothetical protein JCM21714_3995 [Gracilibacillus boraciitolerans JCM 21714]